MIENQPTVYNGPTLYNGDGSVYNGHGVYNMGGGGGGGAVIGGRTYKIVDMPDGKTWLAENLDYKFNGCDIGGAMNVNTPRAWYYNNDENTYGIDGTRKCGLLYNWYACKYLEDHKDELCPGWHVPSTVEFEALASAAGGSSVAGTKLKAVNNSIGGIWPTGWNGTDNYGFSALPSGGCGNGIFNDIGVYSIIWTSTEINSTSANRFYFSSGSSMVKSSWSKDVGYVLRLVKDP